jgi:hypothetical protein
MLHDGAMGAPDNCSGPDDGEASWASESLPLSVRRELLQRELDKLGFHKAAADAPRASLPMKQQQQQQQQPQPQVPGCPPSDADGKAHG